MNERYVARKSHDATQKKCPHVVHFNVPRDLFESNSRHQKRCSEGGKKNRGCRGLLGRVIPFSHIQPLLLGTQRKLVMLKLFFVRGVGVEKGCFGERSLTYAVRWDGRTNTACFNLVVSN